MALAPQHKVDAPIDYVCKKDPSFDIGKFVDEVDKMEANGGNTDEHCMIKYYNGSTRYDRSVEGVSDYFDGDETVFAIKRLNRKSYTTILNIIQRGDGATAKEFAFQFGVREIGKDNEFKLEGIYSKEKTLSEGDMDRIATILGRDVIYEVGQAVINASGDLTPAEKKA